MPKGSGRTKNLRYGATEEQDGWEKLPKEKWGNAVEELFGGERSIFKDDGKNGPDGISIDDMEDIYELDLDLINKDANTLAASNIQNLLRLYNNKEFVDAHPDFKRRIDTEIEGLRKLYKMAKIDEETHDHLCTAISKNPSNASLYMAQVRLQEKILTIDEKIRDRVANFNKIIAAFQLELNFNDQKAQEGDGNTAELDDGAVMARGSKAFVEQMQNQQEEQLFEENMDADGNTIYDPDDLPPFAEITEDGHVVDTDTGDILGVIRKEES